MRSSTNVTRYFRAGSEASLVVLVLMAGFLFAGCDLGNSSEPSDGTVTVRVTNTSTIPIGGQLSVGIKTSGAPSFPDLSGLVGSLGIQFNGSDEVSLTLQEFDGIGPNGIPWVGERGWGKYDLYVLVETGVTDQLFNEIGDYANGFPGRVAINGDTVITFRYPDDFRAFE